MKAKYKFLFVIIIFLSIYSCNNSKVDNTIIEAETEEVIKTVSNRTTLESFWEVFQTAVKDRDIATIESLFAPDAVTNKFGDKEYQEKIAKGKASDIISRGEIYQDKEVHEFTMSFPPETITDDGENEESTTTIYIWKNDDGAYEIFNLLEAG